MKTGEIKSRALETPEEYEQLIDAAYLFAELEELADQQSETFTYYTKMIGIKTQGILRNKYE